MVANNLEIERYKHKEISIYLTSFSHLLAMNDDVKALGLEIANT